MLLDLIYESCQKSQKKLGSFIYYRSRISSKQKNDNNNNKHNNS